MSSSRTMAWMVWVTASIFYAYQYVLRVMPNIMRDDLMDQFGLGTVAFSQVSGIYYIGYPLMHIPIGIMLDRYGPRKVLTACIGLTVVGLLPMMLANHWVYPTLGRALIGMGSSAAILGVFKIIRMTFSEQRFSLMLSFSVTIGLIGAIYGGGPLSYLCDNLGYQTAIQLLIAGGVVLAVVTYIIVPEKKYTVTGSVMANLWEVLSNRRVVMCCMFAGLMVGPLDGFVDAWSATFLVEVYGYDETLAASLPSMIFFGMGIGGPILSILARWLGNDLMTIIGAGVVMTAGFALMLATTLSAGTLTVCFIAIGIGCAYQVIAIYNASTYVREEVAGLTTALANMIIMSFGYIIHTAIGVAIAMAGGARVPEAMVWGVSVVPVAVALGTLGYAGIMRSYRTATVN